ncbi:MAG TPA: preprotein translocase subunit SecE [Bacillota bacterium]|jgi:preprotein translocase subunit SecE|nr:preprotein translocase subunit SecE [Fastidiosipila sp.]HPX93219.1 preprotein translocase subunit SecE [Bacillota bacterium]HQB81081.1 preprotein translocase subunit SecE [Bacillota bacterium]
MANKKTKTAGARGKKPVKKDGRLSLGGRLRKWFVNIITELKRVIWPDRKKLKQSTLTVLLIIAISVVIILVFDTLITFIMRTTGIYSTKEKPAESVPLPTGQEETWNGRELPAARLAAHGVRFVFEG